MFADPRQGPTESFPNRTSFLLHVNAATGKLKRFAIVDRCRGYLWIYVSSDCLYQTGEVDVNIIFLLSLFCFFFSFERITHVSLSTLICNRLKITRIYLPLKIKEINKNYLKKREKSMSQKYLFLYNTTCRMRARCLLVNLHNELV